ncbi:MAG: YvcK family protein [Actinomycetota bacterium]|nr:YvcK family protein [Actinomycetota bacterium]
MTVAKVTSAVAIGGGTGLPLVLRCLVEQGCETTAVVTMADDGGSTGTLRREFGMLPPGDVRNCLVAMAEDDGLLGQLFQYRFERGEGLEGHAVGNLILAALTEMSGGFPAAIEAAQRLLGTRGRVLPSTLEDVLLTAVDAHGEPVRGQARIAVGRGPIANVTSEPADPAAYPPVLEAVERADIIVIGPGSLFTSIVPNFLVSGLADAVCASRATTIYVCNVANQRGETAGMDAADHVRALLEHGLEGAIDVVLVDEPCEQDDPAGSALVCDDSAASGDVEHVRADVAIRTRIEDMGPTVRVTDLADAENPLHHERSKLCRALREVIQDVVHG